MAPSKHLTRAPIREALVDLRVRPTERTSVDSLNVVYEKFSQDYPTAETIHVREFGFSTTSEQVQTTAIDHGKVGLRCFSSDKTRIVQIRKDGFTFSQLPPYKDWEAMTKEARKLWDVYEKEATPVITRVATRFINLMPLPLLGTDFKEYLTSPPSLPESLPQGIISFLNRVVFEVPEDRATVILTQAMEPVQDSRLPVVLDIDVSCEKLDGKWSRPVWEILDTFREIKNRVFFESVTEKTVSLFK